VGETEKRPFQLSFNSSLRVEFQGARVTSDGGLILVRELDERLALSELVDRHLSDSRRGKNIQLPLADLLRQSIYSRLAGYEDVNHAERLSQDPTFRLIGSRKIWERRAALTSRLQSFETEVLTQEENLAGLASLNREFIARAEAIASPRRVVLDMDSTEIPVYGEQEHSAYNGHFECTCYHPAVQSRRRLPGGQAAAWQRPQRRRLGRTAAARDRAATDAGQGGGLSRRRGLRQAGAVRGAGGTGGEVRYPPSCQ
jgi:Transposase DDE domain group 1